MLLTNLTPVGSIIVPDVFVAVNATFSLNAVSGSLSVSFSNQVPSRAGVGVGSGVTPPPDIGSYAVLDDSCGLLGEAIRGLIIYFTHSEI